MYHTITESLFCLSPPLPRAEIHKLRKRNATAPPCLQGRISSICAKGSGQNTARLSSRKTGILCPAGTFPAAARPLREPQSLFFHETRFHAAAPFPLSFAGYISPHHLSASGKTVFLMQARKTACPHKEGTGQVRSHVRSGLRKRGYLIHHG